MAVTAEIAAREAGRAAVEQARQRQSRFLTTGEVNRQGVVDPHQPGAKLDQDKVDLTYLARVLPARLRGGLPLRGARGAEVHPRWLALGPGRRTALHESAVAPSLPPRG